MGVRTLRLTLHKNVKSPNVCYIFPGFIALLSRFMLG